MACRRVTSSMAFCNRRRVSSSVRIGGDTTSVFLTPAVVSSSAATVGGTPAVVSSSAVTAAVGMMSAATFMVGGVGDSGSGSE